VNVSRLYAGSVKHSAFMINNREVLFIHDYVNRWENIKECENIVVNAPTGTSK
jgi:hypothetical protein